MEKYPSQQIRNLILLSHSGAGKTSLAEALLFKAGAITRLGKVEEGNTTSDYDPEEVKRKISINLSLLPLKWKGHKVNIIDTPGYADFVGEVRASLRVADGALMVVCAASGVEVGTELLWKSAQERGLPRLIFINKMDRENADFSQTLGQLQAHFGRKCVPLFLPIGSHEKLEGVVDLITMRADGEEIPPSLKEEATALREKLVEAVAETRDELTSKYLEGGGLTEEEIRGGLKAGTASGAIVPVLAGSALRSIGVTHLLQALLDYLPSPRERGEMSAKSPVTQKEEEIEPDEAAPLTALVFKTTADPYVGKLTYLRVFSGVLYSDSQVLNATKNHPERIGQLFTVRGKAQEGVEQLGAGDIGAVAKLTETATGDTLCQRDHPLILTPIDFPAPVLSGAVHPKTKVDLDKLGPTLARLAEEDPTLRLRKEADTGETILSGLGEAHLEVTAEKMQRKFGVGVTISPPQIPYKETITIATQAEYKHKKQTGGHGQYGHVFLELEPLPRGSGCEFASKVVGGVVPRNYIPAVEKGVLEALQEGVLAGYPVAAVKVTLYDGSYHSVDSSDIAFKIAAAHALRKGLSQGRPILLEPIMNLRIFAPENFTGEIIADLNGKRARVLGMSPGDGVNIIEAQAPLAEFLRYATDLRSITQGRGTHTMEFRHYEEVPAPVAQKTIAARKEKGER